MKVSVLGTGEMGSRIAAALLRAEHEVTIWNRTKSKTAMLASSGAKVAETPGEAVKDADFAISMVRDDQVSRDVWLDPQTGALSRMSASSVAIESSTVTVAWARELAERCKTDGIAFLDAPVTGSRPQADAAQLIYFVGGARETLLKAEPILKTMGGGGVHHAGSQPGSGAAIKLALNALFGIQVAAMGEIIGFLHSCAVDEAQAIEIIASTPVCSPATKAVANAMLTQNFAPLFPIELVEKDFGYVLETAQANGSTVPLAEAAGRVYAAAVEAGYSNENLTSVVKLYLGRQEGIAPE